MPSKTTITFTTAIALVIANMIGTGVFTSLGFQLYDIHSNFSILLLWLIGGVIALCGALVYGEIGAAFPKSGGEYTYLSKLYHPIVGFLSGWVSITIGFAAPVALAAMAMGTYLQKVFPGIHPPTVAICTVGIITLIHSTNLKNGSYFQQFFTLIKLALILVFIGFGLNSSPVPDFTLQPSPFSWDEITSPAFAISLIYVSYAYSGWNAASYISGELDAPQKNLPKALLIGTGIVTAIYLLLHFVFLYSTPAADMTGVVDVGHVSALAIFGPQVGKFMSLMIALLLISSISAMIMSGPRIIQMMGEDMPAMKWASVKNKHQIPYIAILIQSVITVGLILTGQFELVLTFVGFTLSIFTCLTVLGLFRLRMQSKTKPVYRTWGYPLTPILFLGLNLWTIYYTISEKGMASLLALLNLAVGAIIYVLAKRQGKAETNPVFVEAPENEEKLFLLEEKE